MSSDTAFKAFCDFLMIAYYFGKIYLGYVIFCWIF